MILGEATYYYDNGTIFKGILTDCHVQLCNNEKYQQNHKIDVVGKSKMENEST